MTKRPLKPEELRLWTHVARTVQPKGSQIAKIVRHQNGLKLPNYLRLPPEKRTVHKPNTQALQVNQDKKIRRGHVRVDAKIDLHDMRVSTARSVFIQAIVRASNRNHKCLLVITGKGLRLQGVLRMSFLNWIEAPEIRPHVASYAQAHIRHGGSGAWYVFLKS